MKLYIITAAVGLIVGMLYGALNVRSPAPPVVALVGLLAILVGEQLVPLAKRLLAREPVTTAWIRQQCASHIFGRLPAAGTATDKDKAPEPREAEHDPSSDVIDQRRT